jgi:hypothetical protein
MATCKNDDFMKTNNEVRLMERAEWVMEPDCYSGKTCDKMRPRWMTSYPKEGKEEDGETLKLEIDAASMPPGSRVVIEVPVCPQCGDPADIMVDVLSKHKRWPRCTCGFSWNKWAREKLG